MSSILQVENLSKHYGALSAVEDLSFSILPGDIYGFLGQNGAGKSTTMRMMLGMIRPTTGNIYIKEKAFNREQLKHIGAIIERPDMYGYLSGLDNLRIFARLSGIKPAKARLDSLLQLVSLKGREHDKVKAYSLGMKQRLGIAIALVHEPDILMLDEPTNGLDPQGIADMRSLILRLAHEHGKTVIISSHLLHEVEQMATRMLILHRGKKIAEGAVSDLLHPADTLMEISLEPDDRIAAAVCADGHWATHVESAAPNKLLLKMHPDGVPELTRWLVAQGASIRSIGARHSLEAYFLSLTQEENKHHVAAAAH